MRALEIYETSGKTKSEQADSARAEGKYHVLVYGLSPVSYTHLICHALHLPVQHGNNRILQSMNRRYTREKYLERVEAIRSKVPDISLTTDLIVGYPGETEEEFEETCSLVEQVGYDLSLIHI